MVLNMSNETQVNEFTAGSQDNSTVSSSEIDQYILLSGSHTIKMEVIMAFILKYLMKMGL